MVEERYFEKRVVKDGIEVVIVIKDATLDVYITVGTEADISCKHKYEEFTFKFKAENKAKKLDKPVYLSKKRIKYVKGTGAANVKARFKTDEYMAEISITPKLFVPEEVWKEIEHRKQAQMQKNKKKKLTMSGGKNVLRKRYRPTPYTKTNIARPYSGGRCTPK